MKYLGNGFSLNMLNNITSIVDINQLTQEDFEKEIKSGNVKSCIGHEDLAAILSNQFNCNVAFNRQSITLCDDDIFYLVSIKGERLPIGATTLPEGVSLQYAKLRIIEKEGGIFL